MNAKDQAIRKEMKESYLEYSMSVIIGRALPDVRDGLKPVHRRILWSMSQSNFTSRAAYRKSARVVGDTMGKYHPHGDQALYKTIARMAQDFNSRYPLIDGQGNFGSIDGDSPAASRYTECRLEKIAEKLLESWDEETVDFRPNFDNTLEEPIVLPAALPGLLLNGSVGISVGMATNIPPYNLRELCDSIVALIDNPNLTHTEIMNYLPGPDFPTGGIIHGKAGILNAYNSGYGRIVIRGRAEIVDHGASGKSSNEDPYIKIIEIPYNVNKADLVASMANLRSNDDACGPKIKKVLDFSDMDGMEIRVYYEADTAGETILNYLFAKTNLQTSYYIRNIALVDNEPKQLGMREILQAWIDHRETVIVRRTNYRLRKAKEKLHILEGLQVAMDNIDEIIEIIRTSEDNDEIKDRINTSSSSINTLSDAQIDAILNLRLKRLTRLEKAKLDTDVNELKQSINEYTTLLSSKENILHQIKAELIEATDEFGDDRRSEIKPALVGSDVTEFQKEKLIPEENVVVILTERGYLKELPLDAYRKQNRGGKGKRAIGLQDEDRTLTMKVCSNHDTLLLFTNKGKVYSIRAFDVGVNKAGRSKGTNVRNLLLSLERDEKVTNFIAVDSFNEDEFLLTVTEQGYVKRTKLTEFSNIRSNGLIALRFKESDDSLIKVKVVTDDDSIILGTRQGMSIHFRVKDIRPLSRTTMGVKGIDLAEDDKVVGAAIVKKDEQLLTVTENGYGKRTDFSEYRIQRRYGKGLIDIDTGERNGKVISVRAMKPDDELMLIDDTGQAIRIGVKSIRAIKRNTKGVRLMKLEEGHKIVACGRIVSELFDTNENNKDSNEQEGKED